MSGIDQLRACFQQDEDAVRLMLMLQEISHTWDDLIDKDKPVKEIQIHRAFWLSIVGLRLNPFYQRFETALLPILEAGMFNFIASVELERWPGHPRQLAHTARYAVADVALVIARLIGGVDWAAQQAPKLKLLLQQDTFEAFNTEMEAKHGTTQDPAAA